LRKEARNSILERNSSAFDPKIEAVMKNIMILRSVLIIFISFKIRVKRRFKRPKRGTPKATRKLIAKDATARKAIV